MAIADRSGTGTVSLKEFARLRQLLAQLDHTQTRRINHTDLTTELSRLGLDDSPERVAEMIELADVTQNGKVDVFEFWRLLVVIPEKAQGSGSAIVREWCDAELVASRLVALRIPPLDTPGELFAGTACGAAACFVGHPFDTVKVKMQMDPNANMVRVARQLGVGGLYSGLVSPLITQPAICAIVFAAYGIAKSWLKSSNTFGAPGKLSVPEVCMAGAFAGIVNSAVIGPMELVKCTMQTTTTYSSSFACANSIVRRHGISSLCRGMVPTVLREAPAYVGYFASYELGKRALEPYCGQWSAFTAGGVAGVVTWTVSYPQVWCILCVTKLSTVEQDVIKSHIQLQDLNKPRIYKPFLGACSRCITARLLELAVQVTEVFWRVDVIWFKNPAGEACGGDTRHVR